VKLLGQALGILFGLVVGAVLIYTLLPAARAREDRHRLSQSRATCQVLLLGPSYANMVSPNDFDAEARRIGLDKRLCKLGRPGMAGFELKREIDFALGQDWPKLELLLVDITLGESAMFPEDNWFKSRAVEWHTLLWNEVAPRALSQVPQALAGASRLGGARSARPRALRVARSCTGAGWLARAAEDDSHATAGPGGA
jgi:hypothetical protein